MPEGATGAKPAVLKIRFRCMCFFVPDEKNKRMHVLMPDTTREGSCHSATGNGDGGHGAGESAASAAGVEKHVVRVIYDKPGGRLGFVKEQGLVLMPEGGGVKDFIEMEGWELVFPGNGVDSTLPVQIPDLSATNGPVNPALLGAARQQSVISRVVMEGGKCEVDETESAAIWHFQDTDQPLAQEVVWSIPLEAGKLSWQRKRFRPEGEAPAEGDVEELPELLPNAAGNVELVVQHVTATDFPSPRDKADPDTRAGHFAAFYCLFDEPADTSIPVFVEEEQGRFITCITARGS